MWFPENRRDYNYENEMYGAEGLRDGKRSDLSLDRTGYSNSTKPITTITFRAMQFKSRVFLIFIIGLVVVSLFERPATAQTSNSSAALVKECNQAGISLEDCSDQAILKLRGEPAAVREENATKMTYFWSTIAVITIAGGAGAIVFFVKSGAKRRHLKAQ
ncbi:MAG: hypothetical protein ABI361_13175 [Nitrososphaera sp.]